MSTRITNWMISRSVLNDLNDVSTAAREDAGADVLGQADHARRPTTRTARAARSACAATSTGTQQYQRNVSEAEAWQIDHRLRALERSPTSVHRAQELAVQGASDAAGQSARTAAAAEIDQLIASVKQEANASYGGRYVFSGTTTDVRPYT